MASKTYGEKLKDPRWQKVRLQVFERDQWTCKYCKDPKSSLHVHHTEYAGEPWDVPIEKLITLCEYCHLLIETGEFKDRKIVRFLKYIVGDYKVIVTVTEDNKGKRHMTAYEIRGFEVVYLISFDDDALEQVNNVVQSK